jgi:hypothetical protein
VSLKSVTRSSYIGLRLPLPSTSPPSARRKSCPTLGPSPCPIRLEAVMKKLSAATTPTVGRIPGNQEDVRIRNHIQYAYAKHTQTSPLERLQVQASTHARQHASSQLRVTSSHAHTQNESKLHNSHTQEQMRTHARARTHTHTRTHAHKLTHACIRATHSHPWVIPALQRGAGP